MICRVTLRMSAERVRPEVPTSGQVDANDHPQWTFCNPRKARARPHEAGAPRRLIRYKALGRSRQRSDISRPPPTVILPASSAWHPRDGASPAIGSTTIATGMELLANHGRHGGELLRGHFRLQQQWPTQIECAGPEASCGCMEVRCRYCNSKLISFCCDALVRM